MLVGVCMCEKLKNIFCRPMLAYDLLQQILRKELGKKTQTAKPESSRACDLVKNIYSSRFLCYGCLKINFISNGNF